jgi:hypothetical protein
VSYLLWLVYWLGSCRYQNSENKSSQWQWLNKLDYYPCASMNHITQHIVQQHQIKIHKQLSYTITPHLRMRIWAACLQHHLRLFVLPILLDRTSWASICLLSSFTSTPSEHKLPRTVVTSRWINKEVVLPFPLSFDVAYILYVGIMFALTNKSICWVDLLRAY